MHLSSIIECVSEVTQPLVISLQKGEQSSSLGLRGSARLPVLVSIQQALNIPILFLTDRADRVLSLAEELKLWNPRLHFLQFPEPAPLFYEQAAWGESNRYQRLLAITTLAKYFLPGMEIPQEAPIILSSARAFMTRTLPRIDFLNSARVLHVGQTIQINEIVRICLSQGYENVNTVISSGQFAHRGGILDLWSPADPYPLRLEFFGDEIETIRSFDPTTQRTKNQTKYHDDTKVFITCAREFISNLNINPEEGNLSYSEFHIPVLHPNTSNLIDYLPANSLVVFDDKQVFQDTVNEIEEQAVLLRKEYIAEGILDRNFPIPYLSWTEILDELNMHPELVLGLPTSDEIESNCRHYVENRHDVVDIAKKFVPGPRFGGRLRQLMDYLSSSLSEQDRFTIVSRQSARLKELWTEWGVPISNSTPSFIEGSLTEGWILDRTDCPRIHLLTDGEIFGWRPPELRKRARRIVEAPEAFFADLQIDDYVVHIDHGIGVFRGLVQRNVDGLEREYLCIEYADETQLYVPVHQADRLSRYIGPDSRLPSLSRLGGLEWRNSKSKTKEAVNQIADDLLQLYAERSTIEGFAFSADTPWQKELETSFPYIETEDQIRVISEVKQDMEYPKPMDRLICGDVGYGKTEVALRAAFKAVMDGKQVAMLVPTTVLAQQHYHTFKQRLAAFPIEVEMLSRFRSPNQQRRILSKLANGQIDIIIGTHRLFSPDVIIRDLGLLIIDEEQRFGVTHKERLKQMRIEVDVLTLTATPIPRSLYMALSGLRDISTIDTPPEERLPIITHVGPYSPRLVRQAVLRELDRGGQIFFVHNRVQTIGAMQSHLSHLIPEARIGIAHGQMPEAELENRMEQFTEGTIDVLLSTSIIESGLDIPNANTLIVDRADTFGLSQLYQLRGRVGRGAQRAYAYFFRHKKIAPTLEGRQRLETIAENSQLGAGFSIAMRDLEIRGAGDILGTRQHGHIAAVGFHLFTRLLSQAVKRLRNGQDIPENLLQSELYAEINPVNVDLPLPVSIPAEYVSDKTIRLSLYRRMANLRSVNDIETMIEEFKDRFGPPPDTLHNLFYQLRVKLQAEHAGLASISVDNGQIVMRYPDDQIPDSLPDLGQNIRPGKTALWMPYNKLPNWRYELVNVLGKLSEQHQETSNQVISWQ